MSATTAWHDKLDVACPSMTWVTSESYGPTYTDSAQRSGAVGRFTTA